MSLITKFKELIAKSLKVLGNVDVNGGVDIAGDLEVVGDVSVLGQLETSADQVLVTDYSVVNRLNMVDMFSRLFIPSGISTSSGGYHTTHGGNAIFGFSTVVPAAKSMFVKYTPTLYTEGPIVAYAGGGAGGYMDMRKNHVFAILINPKGSNNHVFITKDYTLKCYVGGGYAVNKDTTTFVGVRGGQTYGFIMTKSATAGQVDLRLVCDTALSVWSRVTDASNTSPIVITTTNQAHGLANGDTVIVDNVLGNTAANGTWVVANVTSFTAELVGSAGNGVYSSPDNTVVINKVTPETISLDAASFHWLYMVYDSDTKYVNLKLGSVLSETVLSIGPITPLTSLLSGQIGCGITLALINNDGLAGAWENSVVGRMFMHAL